MKDKVNIRPKVNILSVLKHLNYRSWYALAEFVDNALDSYHREKARFKKIGQDSVQVKIDINPTSRRITVTDNAGGIHKDEFPRAFRTAEVPPDTEGLSEFGMGMKSASCWFTNTWAVRTKSLDDEYEYEVKFDIANIVKNQIEEVQITKKKVRADAHYTVIELNNVNDCPVKKSLAKIKRHLTGMYRQFIRRGELKLMLNGELLEYEEPKILLAPHYKNETGPPVNWTKEIDITIDKKHSAKGFVAILETGSTAFAGLALFRKNRVIQGSGDEGYRPEIIFGNPNSYEYQRLFGEIFLEGFEVSHTKDGIQWADLEEVFLNKLKAELKKTPNILAQAQGFRKRPKREDIIKSAGTPLERTSTVLAREGPEAIQTLLDQAIGKEPIRETLPRADESIYKIINLDLADEKWEVHIELCTDETVRQWLDIGEQYVKGKGKDPHRRKIGIRLCLAHPFMVQFVGTDNEKIELTLRIAIAICIGEVIARESGVKSAQEIRNNINELIESTLAKPE
jgi:hypothetical protein